jgi:hypothetical protein
VARASQPMVDRGDAEAAVDTASDRYGLAAAYPGSDRPRRFERDLLGRPDPEDADAEPVERRAKGVDVRAAARGRTDRRAARQPLATVAAWP